MARTWKPTLKQQNMMSLYGIDWDEAPQDWHMKFGSMRLPLLNQIEPSDDDRYYPTTPALVRHMGLLQSVEDDPELWAMYQGRPEELKRRIESAEWELNRKILVPVRKQLDKRHQLYFYRSAAVELKASEKTGLIDIVAQGRQMVKLLPMSVQVAEANGMRKKEIQAIAPEVAYILDKRKIAYRTVREERELLGLIDGWMPYITDIRIRERLWKSFKAHSPCIVGRKVTQLMLHA